MQSPRDRKGRPSSMSGFASVKASLSGLLSPRQRTRVENPSTSLQRMDEVYTKAEWQKKDEERLQSQLLGSEFVVRLQARTSPLLLRCIREVYARRILHVLHIYVALGVNSAPRE